MKLRVKNLGWSAGIPVAMLHKNTADKIGIHPKDRISIKTFSKNPKEISAVVNVVKNHVVKENELAVSSEIKKILSLKKRSSVDVNFAGNPESLNYIKKKLDGHELSKKEISYIIRDIVNNSLSEAEIAMFISAMYEKGTTFKETLFLTEAISESGKKLSLKNKMVADKHSIGGIAGNRTTPIVVAICAAGGLTMPKTSSRAITSAAGTADTIETIAEVEFPMSKVKKIISKTNACMVWGGSLGMVPADSKIIKIEKALSIDPKAQLLASIMSKKLAVGSKYILIDIPYGKFAKVTKQKAENLKNDFERLGKHFNLKLKVILTPGKEPIGNGVGPVLEIIDVIKVLDPRKKGPKDLEEKSIFLSGKLFELTGKVKKNSGEKLAREILYSGKAFEKFKEIINAQNGAKDLEKIKPGKYKKNIVSKHTGKIKEINNKKINSLARVAGCPIDKQSGLYLHKHVGEKVKQREKLITIYAISRARLREAVRYYKKEKPIKII